MSDPQRLLPTLDHYSRAVYLKLTSPGAADVYKHIRKRYGSTTADISRATNRPVRAVAMYCGKLKSFGLIRQVNPDSNRPPQYAVIKVM